MKKFLIATTALVAMSAAAAAADLPVRTAAPVPVFAAAPFSWTGFYVGVNVGAGANRSKVNEANWIEPNSPLGDFDVNGNVASRTPAAALGALGGVQAGYNFQTGSLVFGVETDLDLASMKSRSSSFAAFSGAVDVDGPIYYGNGGTRQTSNMTAFGTTRLRLGVAADRALFFVTGGLAYGKIKNTAASFAEAGDEAGDPFYVGTEAFGSSNKWKMGWTLGGGMEYALTNNWTVKAEGLYYNLQNSKVRGAGVDYICADCITETLTPYTQVTTFKNDGIIARLGLNYKFGGPAAVVAKY